MAVRCGLGAAALAWVACASAPLGAPSTRAISTAGGQVVSSEQHLFRLTFDGGEGRISLRVVLRTTATDRYQISASDVAGRKVWSLDYSATRTVLVDHRERMFCVGGPDLRLSQVHPDELPLGALPRVLRGELPIPMNARAIEKAEGDGHVDEAGRRWRARHEGGVLISWSLYDEGGSPSVWWTRQDRGGILSRRGGQQYRWSKTVSEPTDQPLADVVPEGFAEGFCGD